MLRQDSAGIEPKPDSAQPTSEPDRAVTPERQDEPRQGRIDIQQELNRLEEAILDSPRIPFTGRTLVDEEPILDILDSIRLNLPTAFQEAEEVLRQKDEIFRQAEQYGREIVEAAEQQAASILDEMGLVRQAKVEADRMRQQVQADCEMAQEQARAEIERMQRQIQQELEEVRSRALAEAEVIESGADEYADRVLLNIEQQLSDMMRVIRNGRQQLQQEAAYRAHQKEPQPQSPSNMRARY
ncbi:MAG: DivIVA domain-containing protein [Cyanobacteria bacterium SID2]|nr:DivIVA domain-containing protein [Cyanobacteria bacterium SID2]MBP0004934.1 DivIVA domain-containing protein [Cyanobacteria bacterium SBC]